MSIVDERFEKWVNSPNLDPRYKEELEKMTPQERNDAVSYTHLTLPTNSLV